MSEKALLRRWHLCCPKDETEVVFGRGLGKGNIKGKDPEVRKSMGGQCGWRYWTCRRVELCLLLQPSSANHRPPCRHPNLHTCRATHHSSTHHAFSLLTGSFLLDNPTPACGWVSKQHLHCNFWVPLLPSSRRPDCCFHLCASTEVYKYCSFIQLTFIECFLSAQNSSKHLAYIN